jgi:cation-transporting P-type ATPase E
LVLCGAAAVPRQRLEHFATGYGTSVNDQTVPGSESLRGLTSAEVSSRKAAGETNRDSGHSDRTFAQIIKANVFTRFNAILGALLVVILILGPAVDGLFGIILVMNALIGIVQEVRAKQTLDHLVLVTTSKIPVLRDTKQVLLISTDIVRSDIVGLLIGSQIVADGPVLVSDGLEVDESLLTGESEPQARDVGDQLRSGSFVTAGSGWFRAEQVGDSAFANTLAAEARKFAPVTSELRDATDSVLRLVTWGIGPIAAALLIGQRLGGESWRSAVFGSATGVVEMVPEGFVLLTSMTLALSVIRLGKQGVLVKELGAVEGLARVNTMCFDKTGTLTEGAPVVDAITPFDETSADHCREMLRALTSDGSNQTAKAIQEFVKDAPADASVQTFVPFSSARKWAGITLNANGANASKGSTESTESTGPASWIMGAPEIVLGNDSDASAPALAKVKEQSDQGKRVLVLATTSAVLPEEGLPPDLKPSAMITLTERIRPDAAKTLQYFDEQQVEVKVISGDNPSTVAAIARAAGMTGLDEPNAIVDARTLKDNDAIATMIASAKVIGRSSPEQKRIMVQSLKEQNRTVAMTGDGVNDALALKDADLAIAMGSGSEATRAVGQLVLVDGGFASLPGVVAEGRRVIANVERVAKLFLTKTMYASVLAVATGIARVPFPFLPRQLTLVSALTIGIPGFFLAFAAEAPPTEPGFMARVAQFSIPAGFTAAIATFATYTVALHAHRVSAEQARTASTLVLGLVGLWIVSVLARPLTKRRDALLVTMAGAGVASFVVPQARVFWKFDYPPLPVFITSLLLALAAVAAIEAGWRVATYRRAPLAKVAAVSARS